MTIRELCHQTGATWASILSGGAMVYVVCALLTLFAAVTGK